MIEMPDERNEKEDETPIETLDLLQDDFESLSDPDIIVLFITRYSKAI